MTKTHYWLVKRPDYQNWQVWDFKPPEGLGLEWIEVVSGLCVVDAVEDKGTKPDCG